mmetsp:Transcript_93326/g.268710  ORF Transcript_93326/g.268710 Transcript_93326/m.268710 type:complete len:189 (-) Transcript_93326:100-666(-)
MTIGGGSGAVAPPAETAAQRRQVGNLLAALPGAMHEAADMVDDYIVAGEDDGGAAAGSFVAVLPGAMPQPTGGAPFDACAFFDEEPDARDIRRQAFVRLPPHALDYLEAPPLPFNDDYDEAMEPRDAETRSWLRRFTAEVLTAYRHGAALRKPRPRALPTDAWGGAAAGAAAPEPRPFFGFRPTERAQ